MTELLGDILLFSYFEMDIFEISIPIAETRSSCENPFMIRAF